MPVQDRGDSDDADALETIRECLLAERFDLTDHFIEEMDADRLLLSDVLAVILGEARLTPEGLDRAGFEKYRVEGTAADHRKTSVILALHPGPFVKLITVYVPR